MLLEAIFGGEFYPAEAVVPRSTQYKQLIQSSNLLLEKLKIRLSSEDFAMVEQLLEQDLSAHSMECECHFRFGFSAGLVLLQEAYQELQRNVFKP